MKKIIYTAVTVGLLMTFSSCKKSFLEVNPMQDIAVDGAITNVLGAKAAVTGLYGTYQSANLYGRTLPTYADLMADNIYISRRNSNRYQSLDQQNITVNDGTASGLWNGLYAIISNANILIRQVGKVEFPGGEQAEVDHITGEAYAIRAWAYMDLLRLFSAPYNATAGATHLGVPIVTNGDYSVIVEPARNTVSEVYTQIIDDLKKAITLLPVAPVGFSTSYRGRITLNAAKGLLARAYLYKEDWVNAETMATEVISTNKYTLLTNGNYVTNLRLQNNSETIFEIQFNPTDNLGSDALVNFYKQSGSYGDALATNDLYNIFTATDVRRGHLLLGRRTGSGGENPAVQVTKFDNTATFEEGSKVIRLAEVYLIRAEARARQTPAKETDAIADLDIIRLRADLTAATTTATGTNLLDAIQLERRKELMLEGHRLFDLNRTKTDYIKYRTGDITIPIANTSLKRILPIPQSEMNNNRSMEQNEGYK